MFEAIRQLLEGKKLQPGSKGPVKYKVRRSRIRKKSPFHKNKAFRLHCIKCGVQIPWYRDTLLCDQHKDG